MMLRRRSRVVIRPHCRQLLTFPPWQRIFSCHKRHRVNFCQFKKRKNTRANNPALFKWTTFWSQYYISSWFFTYFVLSMVDTAEKDFNYAEQRSLWTSRPTFNNWHHLTKTSRCISLLGFVLFFSHGGEQIRARLESRLPSQYWQFQVSVRYSLIWS